jgi:hypothetical protein
MGPDLNPDGLQCKLNNKTVHNSKSKVANHEGIFGSGNIATPALNFVIRWR